MKIFITWTAIGSVAGAVLGFVGLLSYALVFDFTTDPDSRAMQDFAMMMGTGFFAIVGCVLGGICGIVRVSRQR